MLELYEYDYDEQEKICVLHEAFEVKECSEINSEYTLDFKYPVSEKSSEITINRLVKCEGQFYRIITITRNAKDNMLTVNCKHIYDTDSLTVHLPTFPTDENLVAGASPKDLVINAFLGSGFTVVDDENTPPWVGWNRFKIDFEPVDKTSPNTVMKQIIENCGFGEIYKDNKNVALVTGLGKTKSVRLSLTKNLSNLTVTRDIGDIVNRLYPYGESDATITDVYGLPYVDSEESIQKYGLKVGYKDYSDYIDPSEILKHALWEFDEENLDRIDVPHITIEGEFIDLYKLAEFGDIEKLELGDSVIVRDFDGTEYKERVIRLERYPYEPQRTVVTIGRVKKDLAFYLNQIGRLSAKYNKISTISGKISAKQISGDIIASSAVSSSNVNMSTSDTAQTSELIQVIVNNSTFVKIGIDSGNYVFSICDAKGTESIKISDSGGMEFTGDKITIAGKEITTDTDGDLCIAGKKILLQEETNNEA